MDLRKLLNKIKKQAFSISSFNLKKKAYLQPSQVEQEFIQEPEGTQVGSYENFQQQVQEDVPQETGVVTTVPRTGIEEKVMMNPARLLMQVMLENGELGNIGSTKADRIVGAITEAFGEPYGQFRFFIKNPNFVKPQTMINISQKMIEEINKEIDKNKDLTTEQKEIEKGKFNIANPNNPFEGLTDDHRILSQWTNVMQKYFSNELIDELNRLIINRDPTVDLYVRQKGAGERIKEETRPQGMSFDQPAPGEEKGSFGDTIGTNTVEKRLKEIKEDPVLLQQNRELMNHMVSTFANGYLRGILKEVHNLTSDVVSEMMEDAKMLMSMEGEKNNKNGRKIQNNADMLLVYMNSCISQLDNIFSEQAIKDKRVNITPLGNSMRYVVPGKGKTGEEQSGGGMQIPDKAIASLLSHIISLTGLQEGEMRLDDPNIQSAIKSYIDSNVAQWLPDWSSWVSGSSINQKYKEIGKIKKEIKKWPKDDARIIIDKLSLGNLFEDPQMILDFVNATKNEDNKITKEWLGAGEGTIEGGGQVEPKGKFSTMVKSYMPYMYRYKDKYSPSIMKTFFNLVKPHDTILRGKREGKTPVRDAFNKSELNMNNTDLYYNLIEEQLPHETRLRSELKNKKEIIKKINDNPNLKPQQKIKERKLIEKRWEKYEGMLVGAEGNHKKKKRIQRLVDKIERDEISLDSMTKSNPPRVDKRTNEFKIPKGQISLKNKINKLKSEKEVLLQEIALYEQSPMGRLPETLANEFMFRMVYASYERTKDYIARLDEMKSKYQNIKMASCLADIDILKHRAIQEFDNNYGRFFKI